MMFLPSEGVGNHRCWESHKNKAGWGRSKNIMLPGSLKEFSAPAAGCNNKAGVGRQQLPVWGKRGSMRVELMSFGIGDLEFGDRTR